jgi:hypothetical protein
LGNSKNERDEFSNDDTPDIAIYPSIPIRGSNGFHLAIQMASAASNGRVALALPSIGRSTDANCASLSGALR